VLVVVVAALLQPVAVWADVLVFCLDTSGSMQKQGKFDAAKSALTRQIREAQPGDVIYVIAFDSNDYPIGRLDVGEDGSPEAKEQLIAKLQRLKARGRYTNLDEPLQAAKAFLLEERAPGARKIVILSDGVSDPSPDHSKVDLTGIGQMIPQTLGWAVYIVGLPDDIAGLFQTQPPDSGLVLAPEEPHIKGIALQHFSRARIEEAVTLAKNDVPVSMPPPQPTAALPVVQETSPPPPVQAPPTPLTVAEENQGQPEAPPSPLASLLPWGLTAGLLAAIAVGVFLPRWRRPAGKPRASFVLEVQEETGDVQRVPFVLGEGEQKTIGPQGAISLVGPSELPAVVYTLRLSKGQLWLTPQDTITVNGRPVTTRTPVGPGDRLTVRERVRMILEEGEEIP
jgi:hypothetical protein